MTVSVRLEHRAGDRAAGARRHDLREGVVPKYVDRKRSYMNSVLVEPLREGELKEIVLSRRNGKKRSLRRDAALSTNGILTFGREAQSIINSLPLEEQDRLLRLAAEKVSKELDNDLTGAVVHRDERAIHLHFQMPSWNKSGKPNSKIVDPEVAAKLQDIVSEPFSHLGIERGKPKEQRIADGDDPATIIHRSVKRLHQDLPEEIEQKEAIRDQIADQIISLEGNLRDRITAEIKELPQYPSTEIFEIVTGREGKNVLTKNVSFFRAEPVKKFLAALAPRLAAERILEEDFVPRRDFDYISSRLAEKEKELEAARKEISRLAALVEKARKFVRWVKETVPWVLERFNQEDSPEKRVRMEDSPGEEVVHRTP